MGLAQEEPPLIRPLRLQARETYYASRPENNLFAIISRALNQTFIVDRIPRNTLLDKAEVNVLLGRQRMGGLLIAIEENYTGELRCS